ncbi:MAG: IS256 family transposase [Candidatus Omnitrophota bacterium]
MRSVNFSKDSLPIQYQYLKRNLRELGILANLDDFEQKAHRAIERLMQDDIYEEFKLQIGADRYEHASSRIDERKGEYQRFFTTTFGTSRIMIPRTRDGLKIHYSLFDKYQRRQKKFDNMVILSMILGLSTRKQRKFFKSFIGDSVSHATASKLLNNLEGDLKEFRTKRIEDKYKYILVDGLWIHIKEKTIRKRPIIFVLGITLDNKEELLAFKLAKGESEAEVTPILNDLYRRGLEGKHLKVAASDDAGGIKAAIDMVYPYAKWQLCSTHKLRNVSKNIKHKKVNRKKMMKEASKIYKAKTKNVAIKRFNRFSDKWKDKEPKAVRCFRKKFNDTLTYYDFMDDKNFISTTNHLERDLEEIRRRIKIQGYFKNEKSLNLWIFGIISQSKEEQQPEDMPNYTFTLVKEPFIDSRLRGNDKYESAQLS